jgi:hypothetical protein
MCQLFEAASELDLIDLTQHCFHNLIHDFEDSLRTSLLLNSLNLEKLN